MTDQSNIKNSNPTRRVSVNQSTVVLAPASGSALELPGENAARRMMAAVAGHDLSQISGETEFQGIRGVVTNVIHVRKRGVVTWFVDNEPYTLTSAPLSVVLGGDALDLDEPETIDAENYALVIVNLKEVDVHLDMPVDGSGVIVLLWLDDQPPSVDEFIHVDIRTLAEREEFHGKARFKMGRTLPLGVVVTIYGAPQEPLEGKRMKPPADPVADENEDEDFAQAVAPVHPLRQPWAVAMAVVFVLLAVVALV